MLYSISYDLRLPGRDYTKLTESIKALGPWFHYLESTWVVQTSLDPLAIANKLKESMDPNDYILVVDITRRPRNGWLPAEAWKWLREHE